MILIVAVEDEEEVPPESGTEGKDTNDNKEEADKEKQEESEKNTAEDKNQKTEEASSQTETKVRAVGSVEQGLT